MRCKRNSIPMLARSNGYQTISDKHWGWWGVMKTNRSERNLDQSELGDFALPCAMKCNYLSRRVSSKQWNVLLGLLVEKLLRGRERACNVSPIHGSNKSLPWETFCYPQCEHKKILNILKQRGKATLVLQAAR